MRRLLIACMMVPSIALGQTDLIHNGSFEGDFINTVPLWGEEWFQNPPPAWEEYILTNSTDDEGWYTDSFATPQLNLPFYPFHNAYYSQSCNFLLTDSLQNTLMRASDGRFFVGFNCSNDGNREGVQQDLGCVLNSGDYMLDFDWSRPFNCNDAQFKVHLSDVKDTRRLHILTQNSNAANVVPGQWYHRSEAFNLNANHDEDVGNRWLVFTGALTIIQDVSKYFFLDNVHLSRPCDTQNECSKTSGQICPLIATQPAPANPLGILDIGNVRDMRVQLYNNPAQPIFDMTYHNQNGMPDYYLSRLAIPALTAAATYQYRILFVNDCGATTRSGSIFLRDTASNQLNPVWEDSSANWTKTPVPCCLSTLTLQNMQIVGDVSYIVRDQITVQAGVTLAPNSHVTLQAGNVIELSNVEFDGSNSSLEIVEVPCPNRLASGQACGGGSMVIDAGQIVMSPAFTPDSIATQNGNATPNPKPQTPSPNLWAYPNPFEKEFQIDIALPAAMVCTVQVQDLQMRPIRTVIQDKEMPAGSHQLSVDLGGLPAGVYLLQLQAGGRSYHQRIVKQ